ncbi:unnamed protein product, partial [Urochloa humidicola]
PHDLLFLRSLLFCLTKPPPPPRSRRPGWRRRPDEVVADGPGGERHRGPSTLPQPQRDERRGGRRRLKGRGATDAGRRCYLGNLLSLRRPMVPGARSGDAFFPNLDDLSPCSFQFTPCPRQSTKPTSGSRWCLQHHQIEPTSGFRWIWPNATQMPEQRGEPDLGSKHDEGTAIRLPDLDFFSRRDRSVFLPNPEFASLAADCSPFPQFAH